MNNRTQIICLWVAVISLTVCNIISQIRITDIHTGRIQQEQAIIDALIQMQKRHNAQLQRQSDEYYETVPLGEWR